MQECGLSEGCVAVGSDRGGHDARSKLIPKLQPQPLSPRAGTVADGRRLLSRGAVDQVVGLAAARWETRVSAIVGHSVGPCEAWLM